jgi:hypothetical protein
MENIDAILYINLDHRTDRDEHIRGEIQHIDPTFSKTHRISGEYIPDHGALGCSISHCRALTMMMHRREWKTCMILEDDFTFSSPLEAKNQLETLFKESSTFDVFLLAYNEVVMDPSPFPIRRVRSSQTTSGYIIRQHYLPILLRNFILSRDYLNIRGKFDRMCLDQYWKRLMPTGRWYTSSIPIGYQYMNYSDIEQKIVHI